jgi:hypothetical protein
MPEADGVARVKTPDNAAMVRFHEGMTRLPLGAEPQQSGERNEVQRELIVALQCNTGGQMVFWKSWIDAAQFGFEAQGVIAMRLMKIATGGQDGAAECTRMVLEKIDAGAAAYTAGALAFAGGKSMEAATRLAIAPVKRRVRAIHERLLRE